MTLSVKKIGMSAMCMALGVLFPIVFHMLGGLGTSLLPMHLPVLICGFLCGPFYGLLCGMITPLLSSSLTGMPPMFPIALAMMLELGAYGFFSGFFYRHFKVYPSLIGAMCIGRVVSGIANLCLFSMAGKAYTLTIFLSASFVSALPGILLQLIMIPLLLLVFRKSGVLGETHA